MIHGPPRVVPAIALAMPFMAALTGTWGCARESPDTGVRYVPQKVDAKGLPNAYRLHENVISGGQPAGEEAFAELRALGVRTAISVDGAKPDVATARRYGIRYVHLPHGYDGVSDSRAKELAKAVRDLPGPIYIHCHHGKHRSPTAAAVACVATGILPPAAAVSVLRAAGTSEGYKGLYQAAAAARPLDDALLDALSADFPETARLPPLAEAMVAIDSVYYRLVSIKQAQWQAPKDHPDREAAHEALLLREQFTELLRTDAAQKEPARYLDLLRDSEAAAAALEAVLHSSGKQGPLADKAFDRIASNCQRCHSEFRDLPLGEKAR